MALGVEKVRCGAKIYWRLGPLNSTYLHSCNYI